MNTLRKLLLVLLLVPLATFAQSAMSDSQIMDFIQKETKAGTSRSQIVTKLVQRGVSIDQIRRIRNQYDRQLRTRGLSGAADEAVNEVSSRMRSSNSELSDEVTIGKSGTDTELNIDADLQHAKIEEEVDTVSSVAGKKIYGHNISTISCCRLSPT